MGNISQLTINGVVYDLKDNKALHGENVVQTTGGSETNAMSQKATTEMGETLERALESKIKNNRDLIIKQLNIFKQNLLHGVSFKRDTAIIDTAGEYYNNVYSLTDFIKVKAGQVLVLYDFYDWHIEYGAYVAWYDENHSLISANVLSQATPFQVSENGYIRVSIGQTEVDAGRVALVEGAIPVPNPSEYYTLPQLNDETSWRSGAVVLYDESKLNNVNCAVNNLYRTSNYIKIEKEGLYYISKLGAYAGYITFFDDTFSALGQAILTDKKENFVYIDCAYVILSVSNQTNIETLEFVEAKKRLKDLANAKICFYGDSITCLGNDFSGTSWQGIIKKYFGFKKAISVGIGGTSFSWCQTGENGVGYDLTNHTLGESLPYGATQSAGINDNSTLCSWNRISKTIPKDCDIVFVLGGINDINRYLGDKTIINNTLDEDWIKAEEYTGGDYDVGSLTGGILSTIMKIRAHCPNAKIIMCTPIGGKGATADGQNELAQYVGTNGLTAFEIAEEVKKMACYLNVECWDAYSGAGITTLNREQFIYDAVHPNELGMQRIAMYLIEKFSNVVLYADNISFRN